MSQIAEEERIIARANLQVVLENLYEAIDETISGMSKGQRTKLVVPSDLVPYIGDFQEHYLEGVPADVLVMFRDASTLSKTMWIVDICRT